MCSLKCVSMAKKREDLVSGGEEARCQYKVKANLLWDCVVLLDLDGFPNASRVPRLDRSDELSSIPINFVVVDMGMLDNG